MSGGLGRWTLFAASVFLWQSSAENCCAREQARKNTARQIWISPDRGDGKGIGTQSDPLDGSSARKLDAIFRGAARNTEFRLGADTQISAETVAFVRGEKRVVAAPGVDWSKAAPLCSFLALPGSTTPYEYTILSVLEPARSEKNRWEIELDRPISEATNPASAYSIKRGFATDGAQDHPDTKGFLPKRDWKFIGAGPGDRTTLTLTSLKDSVGRSNYEGRIIGDPGGQTDMSNMVVKNLTLNCNAANLCAGTGNGRDYCVSAVIATGDNIHFDGVHAIHAYGNNQSNLECFVLMVSGYSQRNIFHQPHNITIERCVVDQPDPESDYGGAICLIDCQNGTIRHCRVANWGGTTAYGASGGNVSVVQNTAVDCLQFFYDELPSCHVDTLNLTIRGNTVTIGRGSGVRGNGGPGGFVTMSGELSAGRKCRGAVIAENKITLWPASDQDGLTALLALNGDAGLYSDFSLLRNRVLWDARTNPSVTKFICYQLGSVDGALLEGNFFERPGMKFQGPDAKRVRLQK